MADKADEKAAEENRLRVFRAEGAQDLDDAANEAIAIRKNMARLREQRLAKEAAQSANRSQRETIQRLNQKSDLGERVGGAISHQPRAVDCCRSAPQWIDSLHVVSARGFNGRWIALSRSPLPACARPACAVSWFIAPTTAVATRSRSAEIHGRMKRGLPISNCVRLLGVW